MDDIQYKQFEGMTVPSDIKPLEPFTKRELQDLVNAKRPDHQKVDISKNFIVSLNTPTFRANEVHIHTADIGAVYDPDFDFSDLDEFDAWRKTCKLKYNLQRIQNVNLVRCQDFFHKMQICESLTLFEEVHRMLVEKGHFLISVFDIHTFIKELANIKPNNSMKLYDYEKRLFSNTDSTGVYFNRTIWTYERLHAYLAMSNFLKIIKDETATGYTLTILAGKIAEEETMEKKY